MLCWLLNKTSNLISSLTENNAIKKHLRIVQHEPWFLFIYYADLSMLWLICRHRRMFVSSLCIYFVKAVTAGIKWKEHKELGQSSLKVIRNRKQMVVKKKNLINAFLWFLKLFFVSYATPRTFSKVSHLLILWNAFNNYVYYRYLFSLSVKTTMA